MTSSYAGELPRGDPDLGVPVGQVFSPPYLFNQDGSNARRPVIRKAPARVDYGSHFDVEVGGGASDIGSVVLLRSDHNTHSLTTGDRYVKLAFRAKDRDDREVRVRAPTLPAQAVPGIYMLFVVDANGVPSLGHRLDIKPETSGQRVRFR
jgi:hypothetical protein